MGLSYTIRVREIFTFARQLWSMGIEQWRVDVQKLYNTTQTINFDEFYDIDHRYIDPHEKIMLFDKITLFNYESCYNFSLSVGFILMPFEVYGIMALNCFMDRFKMLKIYVLLRLFHIIFYLLYCNPPNKSAE